MYTPRFLTARLETLARSFPAVVVSGARQVGKSTLLKQVFGHQAEMIVFDPVQDIGNARQDPDLFLDNHPPPVILDEIHYVPELVAALKRRIDLDRHPGQYLLTGSQQWHVLRSLAESLAGRSVFLDLEGFCLGEMAREEASAAWLGDWLQDPEGFVQRRRTRLNLPHPPFELVWRGSLPEAVSLPREAVPDFWGAYFRTYVERDVRLLSEVSDWHTFGRFVRIAAALTAQEINASHVGRELGITPQTARRWLDLLVATFQWYEVPAYSGNAIKRVSGKPKGYLSDTGLACWAQAVSSPAALGGHPLWGHFFESFVASELRKQMAMLSPAPRLHHWRSAGGAEVDLILERDGRFYPIEIKAKRRVSRADARGIKAFRDAYPDLKVAPGLVIAPCERMERISDLDYAMPWDLGKAMPRG
ncbi:ATP-binding protein [Holophaga foetida]|uniref:ATP-binding protein n=1 Tax=Holophaga foetida TaxID=35839 RepID=UPI00024742D8|nr:ATP-binding protein [Holophaga foetida]